VFAATYDLVNRGAERRVLSRVRPLIAGEARGRVLEIGAGTGANFPYYRHLDRLVATEPDPYMARRARARAEELGLRLELHPEPAEALPFRDAAFDSVVVTLVLCTVDDPWRSLAEIRRVLAPDGTFRFVEHVRGEGWLGRAHDLIEPVWRRFGGGCHPNRRTLETIKAAGFHVIHLEQPRARPLPVVVGVAVPREGRRSGGRSGAFLAAGAR
jgi:SAM-dependent methyltransferase